MMRRCLLQWEQAERQSAFDGMRASYEAELFQVREAMAKLDAMRFKLLSPRCKKKYRNPVPKVAHPCCYVEGWEFLCGPPEDENGRPRKLHCPWCDAVCDCEACQEALAYKGLLGPMEPGDTFVNERAYQVAGIKP